jgi:alcohol dehydrogenase class IV
MIELEANWNYPTNIRVGSGRSQELAEACASIGMKSPLLITDPGLAALPMVDVAVTSCRDAGLQCGLFADVQGNPTGSNVTDGVTAFREGSHDGVIAFGGGSALDAAKAVALMAGQNRPLWDFEDAGDNWTRVNEAGIAPIIAIPTTAGTGSEVGRASVIVDEERRVKRIIFHPMMLPAVVILDPELTTGLPPHLTAATGMDALSHNLEAYCAPFFHPMAEAISMEGSRRVKQFLPRAVADGSDLEARTQMLVAATMGATAFQKGLGGMHALAHPLGALYDAHHGLLNAILMPYVLAANRPAIEDQIGRLARFLDIPGSGVDGFLAWVLALREQIEIPHTLSAIDIGDRDAGKVGDMAARDPSAGGNPILFNAEQYSQIFANAVRGQLQ